MAGIYKNEIVEVPKKGNRATGPNIPTTHFIEVPVLPKEDTPALFAEQQVARTEILMLKGVVSPIQLQKLLGVPDPRTMRSYMERVRARWVTVGSIDSSREVRGEGLKRLQLIENELWVTAGNASDTREKLVALKTLSDIQKMRNDMLGLRGTVANLNEESEMQQADRKFDHRLHRQQKLLDMVESITGVFQDMHESGALGDQVETST